MHIVTEGGSSQKNVWLVIVADCDSSAEGGLLIQFDLRSEAENDTEAGTVTHRRSGPRVVSSSSGERDYSPRLFIWRDVALTVAGGYHSTEVITLKYKP